MNRVGPFSRGFWIKDDPESIEYMHTPNVLTFPSPHARANAAQAAMLLEGDRAATRREELMHDLMRERNRLMDRVHQIDTAMAELNGA